MDRQGRALQDGDPAQRRSQRQRKPAQVRARGAERRAECHRRSDLDPRIRAHRGACLLRGRVLGARLDRDPAVDRAAAVRRRVADAHSAAARRRRDDGADGAPRHEAQLRQHHRAAAAARRRRRLQNLLHHGVARRADRPLAVEPHARSDVQRAHHGDRVRQPVAVEPPRHLEHGQADGAGARHHHGGGGAVPAGADGPAARGRQEERRRGGGRHREEGGGRQEGRGCSRAREGRGRHRRVIRGAVLTTPLRRAWTDRRRSVRP